MTEVHTAGEHVEEHEELDEELDEDDYRQQLRDIQVNSSLIGLSALLTGH